MVAASPLFRGLPCDLMLAARAIDASRLQQLEWAREALEAAGFAAQAVVKPGDREQVIAAHIADAAVDLLVMGAYGHSRIRTLIVGSATTAILRSCQVPVLLLLLR